MAEVSEKEVYLPPEIIQHIQSFLDTKESAQTSLLSKSWLSAWSTRPVLIFDENDFPKTNPDVPHPLHILCKKTLNRYKVLNLKVDKFVLGMDRRNSPLAAEFIISALTLGVNEIVILSSPSNVPGSVPMGIDLPAQVFESTTLTRLSVDSLCTTDGVLNVNRVLCSRLTSLFLRGVDTTDNVMRDILLGCPLIENLTLFCRGLENINVSKLLNLVKFHVGFGVRVEFMDGRKVTEFHHLRKLYFSLVTLNDDFFTKFPFMFPCIEKFALRQNQGCQVINISSHSLRHLSLFTADGLKKVQLNVPNITKFKFQACYGKETWINHFEPLPSLSFDNVSRDWESDVQLLFKASDHVIDAWLFEDFRKFLIQLTPSRISLSVAFDGPNIMCEEIPCFPSLPVVENLTVCDRGSKRSESVLHALSKTFSSKVMTKCKEEYCSYCE